MNTETVKSRLRDFYNSEASFRSVREKEDWKIERRNIFHNLIKEEKKTYLLEIGAGTGQDSEFFINCGLNVTAVDLSCEMVKICREKGINAFELDFYSLSALNKKFDCVWAMNCLLHVPKSDLPQVLINIDNALEKNGLFYMGVYGGQDSEEELTIGFPETPRLFSSYSESNIKKVLQNVFEIISFEQIKGSKKDFQSIIMRKR